jgi:hypothetical protein
MSIDFFLVLILDSSSLTVLVFLFFSWIELTENISCMAALDIFVMHEFTVIQGDKWKNIANVFLTVVNIHVVRAYFVFFFLVTDDPVTSSRQQSNTLCNLWKDLSVNHNYSLPRRLLAWNFGLWGSFWSFYSSWWSFITENIVISFWIFLTFLFLIIFQAIDFIVVKHTVVFS